MSTVNSTTTPTLTENNDDSDGGPNPSESGNVQSPGVSDEESPHDEGEVKSNADLEVLPKDEASKPQLKHSHTHKKPKKKKSTQRPANHHKHQKKKHSHQLGPSEGEVSSMRVGEIKEELESMGISTSRFLEKSDLVEALEKARADSLTQLPTNEDTGDLESPNPWENPWEQHEGRADIPKPQREHSKKVRSTKKKVAPGPSHQPKQTSPKEVEEEKAFKDQRDNDTDLESGIVHAKAELASDDDSDQSQFSSYSYKSNLGT